MCEMSKCGDSGRPHVLNGVGHDRDGDEVEYNDKDEESCPLCLHNPTHAQVEGGGCVCLMGDVPVVSFTPAKQKCRLR